METKGPGGKAARRERKTAKPSRERIFENPLLPHKKLTEMYAGMLHGRLLERFLKQRTASLAGGLSLQPFTGREASLIAVLHNLLPQDRVSVRGADPVLRYLRDGKTKQAAASGVLPPIEEVTERLAMAAGVALAGNAAQEMVVAAYLDAAETREPWTGIIETAGRLELPMIFVCQDETRSTSAAKMRRDAGWKRVGSAAAKFQVPVIPVDGQDLIALYRVAQEAIGRARMGLGPSLIWCMRWELGPRRPDPLAEFEQYLAKRRLFTPAHKRSIVRAFEKKRPKA